MSEYVLGTSDHELDRLSLQQEIWADKTSAVLDLVPPERWSGARVLDAAAF